MSLLLAYFLPDPEHSTATRELLVVGYVAAAFCWLRASKRGRSESAGSFWRWWLVGAVLLFLLAINKQFSLRGQFEAGFRALAKAQHWYDQRQPMQFVLAIVLPSVLALLTAVFLGMKGRIFLRHHPLALAGWAALLLYLALRQTQEWKPVLPFLSAMRYYDWRLALEVGGMLLVVLAALIARPSAPSRPLPPPANG
jgi:uncharacterized membrane protein YhaH (DUF805 family)